MEIVMDFNKPSISKKIEKFLLENLKTEKEKESLINVTTGKSVLKGDAIALLLSIIQAMTIADEVNMEEFEAVRLTDDGDKEKAEDKSKSEPTAGHSGANIQFQNGAAKTDLPKTKFNSENVCQFFASNKCRFGKECRKEHPKICNKFKKFGLNKFNKNHGCKDECEFFHPRACYEAMKTKTCKRTACKFYHIAGTKLFDGQENNKGAAGNNSGGNGNQFGNPGNNVNSSTNSNTSATQQSQSPVFQEVRQPWEIAIERMSAQMEKMMNLQQTFQTQIQPLLQPQRSQNSQGVNPNW